MWTLSLCFLYVFKYWIESLHNRTQLRNHVWMDLGTCIIKVISIYRSVRQYVHIILAKMKDKQMTCQGMHDSWVRNVHEPTLLITDELWTQGWFFFSLSECNWILVWSLHDRDCLFLVCGAGSHHPGKYWASACVWKDFVQILQVRHLVFWKL